MTFYANRQISTGFFIPPGGKKKRGHTHQEPSANLPPRMFTSRRMATYALRCWLQGRWSEEFYMTYAGEEGYDLGPRNGTSRNTQDFETVAIQITVEESKG